MGKCREHVRRFIKSCACCQKMSYLRVLIKTHPFTTVAYRPMKRLNMDFVRPMPKDEYGNEYILIIIDTFTRAVGLYPVPNANGIHSARSLLHFMGYFGCPSQIVSDLSIHMTAGNNMLFFITSYDGMYVSMSSLVLCIDSVCMLFI